MHFSQLPRWRGAAPVERAILAGDSTTGVAIMQLEEELDTGPIYAQKKVKILPHETAAELRTRLIEVGTGLLLDLLRAASDGQGLPAPKPQRGDPTYATKLAPDELRLDWSRPPEQLERVVRVGGAWTTFRGKRLKVHRAQLSKGQLELLVVQPEGKGRMPASDWARGTRWQPGEALGS